MKHLLPLLLILPPAFTASAESFTKPLREITVSMGRSPHLMPYDNRPITLSCFFYSDLVVKELNDPGLKGAAWTSVLPIHAGSKPECHVSHEAGEKVVNDFGGSFEGVKNDFVFMRDADGLNGGIVFTVIDWKSMTKLFSDNALFWDRRPIMERLTFSRSRKGELEIKYRRVAEADCSIPKDGMQCWHKIRKQFNLPSRNVPRCSGYKQRGQMKWEVGDPGIPPSDTDVPSAIVYPVITTLSSEPKTKAVRGQLTCSALE